MKLKSKKVEAYLCAAIIATIAIWVVLIVLGVRWLL